VELHVDRGVRAIEQRWEHARADWEAVEGGVREAVGEDGQQERARTVRFLRAGGFVHRSPCTMSLTTFFHPSGMNPVHWKSALQFWPRWWYWPASQSP